MELLLTIISAADITGAAVAHVTVAACRTGDAPVTPVAVQLPAVAPAPCGSCNLYSSCSTSNYSTAPVIPAPVQLLAVELVSLSLRLL
jgi:hypothetical protein